MIYKTQYVAVVICILILLRLMTIIISRWLMWYGSMINLCFFMFFMSISSFYMFLLTYMYQKLKNIKNIYIFFKNRSRIRSQTGSFWKWSLPLPLPLPSNIDSVVSEGGILQVFYLPLYAPIVFVQAPSTQPSSLCSAI